MGVERLASILITPLSRITTPGGDVMHAMKCTDPGYQSFGEAYFSWIDNGAVKAWKRHLRMTLNLVVPIGEVRFVFIDPADEFFQDIIIGNENYVRITVPPGIWFGFQGLTTTKSLVLNLADMPHDPTEVERLPDHAFNYNWMKL